MADYTQYNFDNFLRRDSDGQIEDISLTDINAVFSSGGVNQDMIDSVGVGAITTGTMRSERITLGVIDGAGDVFINSGKLDFTNTDSGFILGLDDSDANKAKFYIGSSSSYLNWDGTTLSIAGTVTATSGTIGGFTIGSDYVKDAADSFGLASTVSGGDDVRFWAGDTFANRATADFRVTEAGAVTASSITITGGSISTSVLNVGLMNWTTNIVFSSTDNDTVSWTSGTIIVQSGVTYTIDAGNTGNMTLLTYIYLNPAVSATVLQTTTTYSTATGDGKILIASAQNHTAGASVIPYGGQQPIINGTDQIAALSIVAGSIAANTITSAKMSVTDLSAISANIGTITSGNITIDTAGYIRGGQTAYNTGTGFFLGYSSGAYKFSLGNPTGDSLTWDGTNLNITAPLNVDFSLTAGDNITQNGIVSFCPNITAIDNIVTTVAALDTGESTTHQQRADSFVASTAATTIVVTLRVKKVGSPSSTVVILKTDSGGNPNTTITSGDINGLTTSFQDIDIVISGLTLTATTTYWISVFCDTSGSNYLVLARDGSGAHKYYDSGGAGWTADSNGDLIYKVRCVGGVATANTVYPATASVTDSVSKVVGSAIAIATSGNPVVVRSEGRVTTFSSLTVASTYYLSTTSGGVTTSSAAPAKVIGRALSTTDLQIKYSL